MTQTNPTKQTQAILSRYLAPDIAATAAQEVAQVYINLMQTALQRAATELQSLRLALEAPGAAPVAAKRVARKSTAPAAAPAEAKPKRSRAKPAAGGGHPDPHTVMSFKKKLTHARRRQAEDKPLLPGDVEVLAADAEGKIIDVSVWVKGGRSRPAKATAAAAPAQAVLTPFGPAPVVATEAAPAANGSAATTVSEDLPL